MPFSNWRFLVTVWRYMHEVAKLHSWKVFCSKILGGGPPKSDLKFLYPYRDTSRCNSSNRPDGISQSTPNFWPIFEVQSLKICCGADPSPRRQALVLLCLLWNFYGATPWDMSVQKSWLWVGHNQSCGLMTRPVSDHHRSWSWSCSFGLGLSLGLIL